MIATSKVSTLLGRWIPGIDRIRNLDGHTALRDIGAGAILTAFLIPVGMAYATASGLPPVTGLYATIVPLTMYAILGPSRRLILGPDSSLAPMIAATIVSLGSDSPEEAVAIAGALAIGAGLLSLIGGFAGFGFLTELLSAPIRHGYLGGVAVVVIISQLPVLLGIDAEGDSSLEKLWDTITNLDETTGAALAIGIFALASSVASRRYPLFPGTALAVVGSVAIVELFDLNDDIETIGRLPSGLPSFVVPDLDGGDTVGLIAASFSIALISFADTSLLSKAYADRDRAAVDPNQELVALGGANFVTGFFQGFPVSASSSRTPVAEEVGARTQLTGVVAAALIAIMLVAAPGALSSLPTATLAAVVIVAVIGLIDVAAFRHLLHTRPREFALGVAAFAGVVILGVLWGVALAIVLSLLAFIQRAWRPRTASLVRVDGLKGYHDASRHPEGHRIPGLLLYRFDAPLFFANANFFKDDVLSLVDANPEPVRWLIISAEPITDIDATADEMLNELYELLEERDVQLGFAELKGPVRETLEASGFAERLGAGHFHRTLGRSVTVYVKTTDADWVDWQDRPDGNQEKQNEDDDEQVDTEEQEEAEEDDAV